ncbi:hypothetical protein BBO99_00006616 [Phytophthora kernoviae]|uniref:Uncharacterized protein n=1 Tax=Phytophthora kernoviae TaxID=325452 RepID=A0A3R7HUK3_9STRA|nr:hypothetical protein BBI17_006640 [Phytophthora kernoviae]RLN77619.1 hypothetical protein BBO99_00006616 [Phytophthora kernoviae]
MTASHPDALNEPLRPTIEYDSGKTLMARGPLELHDHVASLMEKALGKALPQVEVQFQDVSISADIVVKDNKDAKIELPTLANELLKGVRGMRANKYTATKKILKNVSGVFKPGTITLVLGQPGSGKSSLMKLLSGRFPKEKNITMEGEMTYNGKPLSDLRKRLPQLVSYVTQRDKHYPALTVKETLEFAHACCGGGFPERDAQYLSVGTAEENEAALEAARAMFKHYPDIIIQQLGLDNCQNTVVGDAMTRGVSGGERKRVTTGEMEFGNKYVMMMDEISTGLDSATTFDIITTQRSIAKKFRKTVVISLLQPLPEVFDLFDDVVILNEGHIVYHGPRVDASQYFESLGFKCPPHRDAADFLLDLGTDKQSEYEVSSIPQHNIPRSASEFADAFTRSSVYERTRQELQGPVHHSLVEDQAKHIDLIPEFHQNFWDSTIEVIRRQVKLTTRDTAFLVGRTVMVVLMGLLYSSVFYQLDETNAQLVMGIIFNAVLFVSLAQQAQIPVFMAARDVFYKQRRANFYRTASYVLSNSLSQVPLGLAESIVFGSMVYWMCGCVSTVEAFLLFEVVLFLTNMVFAAWFFFLSCSFSDLNLANPISLVSIIFFVLFAGFAITKDQIPDYLIWIYWINPMAWGIRALAVNQYTDSSFDVCVYDGFDYCTNYGMTMGEYSLTTFEVPTDKFWLWYGMVFQAAIYVFFMFLSFISLEYYRFESPENVMLDSENKSDITDSYTLARTPRSSEPRGDTMLSVEPAKEKHFIPVTVAFKDLWYTVPDPANSKKTIDLLKGISGYALPGTITALMGSTGAGKTTLLDVIAGRKTGGKIQGQILLNGHPATDLAIRRSAGYCEQMDIHSETSTIREALTFSAFLRQGADVPDSYKYDSVNECLDLLDLNLIADQIIRGSSVEQMKRLTIGVELAAQPSVLFLDEPTSGLDARSAKIVMNGVRKVAHTGRTIVCTIHQPSSEVFSVFDNLLLLKRGGESVFVGELGKNAREMIHYFESIYGVAKLEDNYNPATWMLEVIGAGVGNTNGDNTNFVEAFKSSVHFERLQANLDREGVSRPSPSLPALEYGEKRAATEMTQARFLIKRFFDMYWRTASYNLTRFSISLMLGLLFGITYLDAEYTSYAGINSGMGMLFCATGFIGFISFSSVLPTASQDRLAFYRERAAQTYNALWYFVGSTVVEIPYVFFGTMLFMAPFFPMVGFSGGATFFAYWLHLSMHVLWQAYFGQLMSYLFPTVEVATIFGALLETIFFLFNGFNPPGGDIPSGYKWLYHITPQKYALHILGAIVFGDCPSDGDGSDVGCQMMTGAPPSLPDNLTVKEYLESVFAIKHSEIWKNFSIMLAIIVVYRLFGLLALRQGKDPSVQTVEDRAFSFLELYRFATPADRVLLTFGVIMAAINGALFPCIALVFGEAIAAFAQADGGVDRSALNQASLHYFLIAIGIFVTDYLAYLLFSLSAERQMKALRAHVLEHMLYMDISWYDVHDPLQLSSRITGETVKIKDGMGQKLGDGVKYVCQFVAGYIIGFARGWDITLVMMCVMPLMTWSMAYVLKSWRVRAAYAQQMYAEAGAVAEETLSSIRTVSSLTAEHRAIQKYNERTLEVEKGNIIQGRAFALVLGVFRSCSWLIYAAGLWYGGYQVYKGAASPQEVFQSLMAVIMGSRSLAFISPNLTAVIEAKGAAIALYDLLDTPSQIDASQSDQGFVPDSCSGRIEVINVDFAYPSRPEAPILINYCVTIEAGQTVAFVGASGGGKSTIISLLERFYDPVGGSILLDGRDLRTLNIKWLRSQIGLVSQEPVLFATTIADNIAASQTNLTREDVIAAAKLANAHTFIMSLPKNYDTLVGEKGVSLSGGQKQRVAIARAIIREPKILIMDEATSALDAESERVVQDALNALMSKTHMTTLAIAHRLSTIRHADKIVVLADGHVVEEGPHDELVDIEHGSWLLSLVMLAIIPVLVLVDEGTITFRQLMRSLMAIIMSSQSVGASMAYVADSDSAFEAGGNILSIRDRPLSIDSFQEDGLRPASIVGRIIFKGILFRYPTRPEVTVLKNYNLTIEPGQTVAFCGPSGGGKSTCISLLERFYDPIRGQVLLDGVDIKELNVRWLRSQIGLVGQEPTLFTGTIAENIAYGLDAIPDMEDIEAVAKMANAHDFIIQFPNGYETQVGMKGEQLSGGQKQRIAIARAILKNPSILLLDEATSALDSESEKIVQEALDKVVAQHRRTTIIIAHRLSTIRKADKICVVSGGMVAEQGTHQELVNLRGIYANLVESSTN